MYFLRSFLGKNFSRHLVSKRLGELTEDTSSQVETEVKQGMRKGLREL